ncbi:hypothetical protein [Pseudoalteromonas sp. S16_S37]|nr:hypothetical protein [Pseudoalteromonas sp. S16_S37]MBD1584787.1 hypothetical protein [Pseudoalteromonas sp. S16_S37]
MSVKTLHQDKVLIQSTHVQNPNALMFTLADKLKGTAKSSSHLDGRS